MAESFYDLKKSYIFSIFFCVLETKYIHASSDLLLNITLAEGRAVVIYPLLTTDLQPVIY